MRIISVEPKDIHVTIELSITEIGKILLALEHSTMEYNKECPDTEKAVNWVKNKFFKTLDEVYESIEKG